MQNILLAGATGYLGGFILKKLIENGYSVRVVARNPDKLRNIDHQKFKVFKAEITQPESLNNCCKDIDTVISTVGITRQRDGLTYMDVDYQANMILLKEAKQHQVRKFIFVSVLNGDKLKHLKICEAKEKFVNALTQSGFDYCIIRPNGFFSDMAEFFQMAVKGRIYLFGNGQLKANPIHGEDLANIIVASINSAENEINAGGPQTLTQYQIAETAFTIIGKKVKITYIPGWISKTILALVRTFTNSKFYGPIEFFMTVLSIDMVAPEYGTHTLKEFFTDLHNGSKP